jgi:polysaccharide biosynthesis transport protein
MAILSRAVNQCACTLVGHLEFLHMNSYVRPLRDFSAHEERLAVPPHVDTPLAFSEDLKGIIQLLRRHAGRFLFAFVFVILLAGGFLYITVPEFTATATVVLDPRKQVVTNSPEVLSDVAPDSSGIDTQVQLIESRAVLGKAVDRLAAQQSSLSVNFPRRFIWQTRLDNPIREARESQASRDELIDILQTSLDVERVGLTSALNVSFKDEKPQQAAQVTNAIATAYIDYQSDLKLQATKDANGWLKQQVRELKAQLENAEAAVDSYRSRSGLLLAKGSTSTESQLTNVDLGVNEARQAESDAQARLDGYRNALRTSGAAEAAKVVASPTMQQLRGQYLLLTNQRAQLSATYGPNYPQMVELNEQITGLQEQMNSEAHRTIEELQNDVAIAHNKVNGLVAIRDQSRKQLASDNAASVKLTQLQSNSESIRQLYEGMLTRLQQVSAQETLGSVNAAIVSEAVLPEEPSSPKLKVVVVAAVAAGLAMGSFAVLLAHLFDGTVLRPKELERRTRVPVLALVPRLRSADLRVDGRRIPMEQIIFDKPMSLFAESFRNLRVAVQHAVEAKQSMVVQLTSGSFGEGKTICSMAFAQAAAMDGRRVLLIDADVRRRSLTNYLGISTQTGLLEVLRGKAQLREAVIPGGARYRPHVLPLSTADAGPHDRFSSETFADMLRKLKSAFDLIVIDSAPVLAVADSLALTQRVDAVVLVTRWAKTPLAIVVKALEEISRVGGPVAGLLLTQVNVKKVSDQTYGRGHYPAMLKYYRQ